jgi:UDP-N-acetylmuramoyl-L-alanyl-D-glutamate--2,6-diaminopimelate ligase
MIGLAEFQISNLLSAVSSRQSYARRFEQNAFSDQKRSPMNPPVSHLLSCVDTVRRKLHEDSAVNCLITDSRRVVPGALFFAIGGLRTDGNLFVEEAVDRGAVAIITEEDLGHHFPIDYIQVADVRQALALI